MYDKSNVFAKILRGEIPCKKICENEYGVSFHDISPCASQHALVIPRGEYVNFYEFLARASAAEQAGFWTVVKETADALGIRDDFNTWASAGDAPFVKQSVPHFHLHLVAGERLKDPTYF
ncbi:MAG: HIT domain-containing protein [Proteobacteria bacterium]|nr:HIT domain-containing protein [Pseudomonadota bacterium]